MFNFTPLLLDVEVGVFLLNEGKSLDADGRMNSITGRVLAIPAASVTNSGASSSRALHVELTSQQVTANASELLLIPVVVQTSLGKRVASCVML